MKYLLAMGLAVACAVPIAGCGGGQDRAALAKQAIVVYWSDVNHGKLGAAYSMLTSGNRAVTTFNAYRQNMFGFLTHVTGVTVTPGKPQITDDRATVAINLHSPAAPGSFKAWQHLFWEGGGWRISDQNGGVSSTK